MGLVLLQVYQEAIKNNLDLLQVYQEAIKNNIWMSSPIKVISNSSLQAGTLNQSLNRALSPSSSRHKRFWLEPSPHELNMFY
jgi:hypothetical protein